MTKKTRFIWWEKTVEYYFVTTMANQNKLNLSPLAGHHELASDLIAACQKGLILIEFKKDKRSLKTEEAKFRNYQKAKDELEDQAGHHFLIYGAFNRASGGLIADSYFAPGSKTSHPLDTLVDKGIPYPEFLTYVKKFVRHKLPKKGGDGPGGVKAPDDDPKPDSPPDYSIVAGISKDGQIVHCMTLDDFLTHMSGKGKPGGRSRKPRPFVPGSGGETKAMIENDWGTVQASTDEPKLKTMEKNKLVPA